MADRRFRTASARRSQCRIWFLTANTETTYGSMFVDLKADGPPDGKQSNWVQTVPGKSWFTILRLYGPLQPWFDKTWRPGEIEPLTA